MRWTIFRKTTVAYFVVLAFVGATFLQLLLAGERRHRDEVNQQLNWNLAANLVKEYPLDGEDGPDDGALEHVFHTMMVVNPKIELYLLDEAGRILTYSAAPGRVRRQAVDLAPIEAFLGGRAELPLFGDDPRSDRGRKVFSVAPVQRRGGAAGYLYVVLASEEYDSALAARAPSHLGRFLGVGLAGALSAALAGGVLLLWLFTGRIRTLTRRVHRFGRSLGAGDGGLDWPDEEALGAVGDEIAQLQQAFEAMAGRIEEQVAALARTDQLRRELVANVSHDLRTPLASLRAYLETLALSSERLDEDRRRAYVDVALRQCDRLGRLVEELFELARLEAAETTPTVEPFSLADLVQDVIQAFQLAADEAGIQLRADVPLHLPLVAGDLALIHRALQNLVENALRHTPAGGAVTLSTVEVEGAVRVAIRDTGEGIPEEEMERIFDRFHRAGAGRPREEGALTRRSVGLGLAIVRRIVELHGERVRARSSAGEGTEFSFHLQAV